MDLPSQVFPLDAAWTVVPGGQFTVAVPLEDVDFAVRAGILVHRPERGPEAGRHAIEFDPGFPSVADQPRQLPRSLPLKYWSPSRVARRTRLELPSRNTFRRSSRYMPHDRREHVVLPVLHNPVRRIGSCTGRAVELVLENVGSRFAYWAAAQRARDPPGGTAKHRLWVGGSRPPRGRSRTSTSCCDDPSEAREHPKGRTRSRARFTDGFCVSGLGGNLGAD